MTSLQRYRERFGDDYFSFWAGKTLFVAINSQIIVSGDSDPLVDREQREQDNWLISTLKSKHAANANHIVLLSHTPPFIEDEAEQHGWANWPIGPRKRALNLTGKAGASLWLCGHLHSNNVGHSSQGTEIVTSSSCGTTVNWTRPLSEVATLPHVGSNFQSLTGIPSASSDLSHAGLRVVRVGESEISHHWFSLGSVPDTLAEAL
jgi:hypothetical protein